MAKFLIILIAMTMALAVLCHAATESSTTESQVGENLQASESVSVQADKNEQDVSTDTTKGKQEATGIKKRTKSKKAVAQVVTTGANATNKTLSLARGVLGRTAERAQKTGAFLIKQAQNGKKQLEPQITVARGHVANIQKKTQPHIDELHKKIKPHADKVKSLLKKQFNGTLSAELNANKTNLKTDLETDTKADAKADAEAGTKSDAKVATKTDDKVGAKTDEKDAPEAATETAAEAEPEAQLETETTPTTEKKPKAQDSKAETSRVEQ